MNDHKKFDDKTVSSERKFSDLKPEKKILFCTVYRRSINDFYDWVRSNTKTSITFAVKRIHSFGLRFIKQNLPNVEILEYPTWDEYVRVVESRKWDVIGFSFYLNEIHEILEMVELARKKGVKEIWAGNYGALTEEIRGWFDRVFIGYSEERLARELGYSFDQLIHPPLVNYLGTTLGVKLQVYGTLFTSRGCTIGCDFCQTPAFCPHTHEIPLDSIKNVLQYYLDHGINEVVILDENFGLLRRHSERVIELLGEMGFYWYAMTKVNQASKYLEKWIQNGFCGALIGIESMNQDVLDAIGKRQSVERVVDFVNRMHRLNRMIIGYYMIGFEDDTKQSIKRDMEKVADLKLDITQICVLTPLPGTKQWDYISDKYGIFDKDWHHYNAKYLVWNHPNISPGDMRKMLEWSFRKCYPVIRPVEMTTKFHRMYRELENKGLLGGLKYFSRSFIKANSYNYYPEKIPLLKKRVYEQ